MSHKIVGQLCSLCENLNSLFCDLPALGKVLFTTIFLFFLGFVSLLFRKKVALALTMFSSCIAMSALFGTLAIAYGLFSLTAKVYIVIVVNVVSVICYVTLEVLLKKEIL